MNNGIKLFLEVILFTVLGLFGSFLILHSLKDFLFESETSFLHDLTSCVNFFGGVVYWMWDILVLKNILKKDK